ncbi:MAG TPA: DNA ligase D [Candidatus Acidoferrales bacterium]|nr:DNA ligase D [Candidatus Acidoferrales bacterium]
MPPGAKTAPLPQWIPPALATLTEGPFSDPDWLYEIKWDGVRTLARIEAGKSRLWSRSHREITREYPELGDLAAHVRAKQAWLDGEIVALDPEGRSDFQKLQLRFSVQNPPAGLLRQVPAVYYCFDLLYLDGHDLREAPLVERKRLLREVLREDSRVRFSDHVIEKGRELFEVAAQRKLEGIVAKKSHGPYPVGRTSAWLKIKLDQELDAVVGGWTDPRGTREFFGALLMGLYEGDTLRYIGGTGSGFDLNAQKRIWPRLRELHSASSPFEPAPSTRERPHWISPDLVARVKFGSWTEGRHLRQPRFLGIQNDRDPRSCTFEEQAKPPAGVPRPKRAANIARRKPSERSHTGLSTLQEIERELTEGSAEDVFIRIEDRRLHLTNLNKVYFPEDGYTKRELLSYYYRVAPVLLPLLKDRPMVLRRYPNGIQGSAFFQKDAAPQTPEWIKTAAIESENRGEPIHYILANDLATLLYLTNLGCVDHNPWASRYDNTDHPDYAFFDLDPTPGAPFSAVVKTAKLLLAAIRRFHFTPFLKTSGATGLHIYIPIEPRYTYEQVRLFVQAVASGVSRKHPGLISFEWNLQKREHGSVYVDVHQNSRGQSLASAYSVRAFPHAPVSAPLSEHELTASLDPVKWNLRSMPRRIAQAGDLWKKFWDSRQQLENVLAAGAHA